ncbi:MAG: shikimate dehydrogenase [Thermoflavifilum sp.]|nr:shikimate dehydrogenase [Thermoflavifilum sp.]MCL6512918.1 shikimate dehydrogenase [Alicyclobacillus sp.]
MGTRLYGLLGWPVGHSVSPAMLRRAFQRAGIDAVYLPFAVPPEQLGQAVSGLRALGARGANVTIPHKESVRAWIDEESDEARLAGAVNTLIFEEDGTLRGDNTDVMGWWQSVRAHLPARPWSLTILGAGGAVRAILAALVLHGAACQRVILTARGEGRVNALVHRFSTDLPLEAVAWDHREDAVARSDVVVQCTPVGMWPHVSEAPIRDGHCFRPGQVVQDLVYRPLQTKFLEMAAATGATVVDGLGMLVGQGAAAFERWTGQSAPVDDMARAAREALDGL